MPAPGTTSAAADGPNSGLRRVLDAMSRDDQRPATKADVQALTDAINRLSALLQPPSALIVTGAEAQQAFSALVRSRQHHN